MLAIKLISYFCFFIISLIDKCVESEYVIEDRILGGNFSEINQIPYIVSVTMTVENETIHNCGGCILSNNVIATAAHCTQFLPEHLDKMKIRAGSKYSYKDGEIIPVSRIIDHESYNSEADDIDLDISLLILSKNLTYSDNVQPIKLATMRRQNGTVATVSGWGYESENADDISPELKSASVSIINWDTCKTNFHRKLTKNQLCAGKRGGDDACVADSGGPLVENDELIGIVSNGYGCGNGGVYVDIVSVRPWIIGKLNSIRNENIL